MRKTILAFLAPLWFAYLGAQAQNNIMVTAEDVPNTDVHIVWVEPQGFIPGLSGPDVNWAYNSVQTTRRDTLKWRDPASSPFVNQFSTSTVVSNFATYYRSAFDLPTLVPHIPKDLFDLGYLRAQNDGLYLLGNATPYREIVLPQSNDTLVLFEQTSNAQPVEELVVPFPLAFGQTEVNLHYRYEIHGLRKRATGGVDTITIVRRLSKNLYADAYGKLVTPDRAYARVVRLRTVIDGSDSMYVKSPFLGENIAVRLAEYHPTIYSWFADDIDAQKQWEVFRLVTTPEGTVQAYYKTDSLPLVNFQLTGREVIQNAGVIPIEVRLQSPDPSRSITVKYTTEVGPITAEANVDFVPATGTITFAPGDTVAYVPVAILEDDVPENRKFFLVKIEEPENAVVGSVNIFVVGVNDAQRPYLYWGMKDTLISEADNAATLPLYLNTPINEAVKIRVYTEPRTAFPNKDYVAFDKQYTIAPNIQRVDIPISLIDDGFLEDARDFVVRVEQLTQNVSLGFPDTVRVRIADDDFKPNLQFIVSDTTVYEATNGESNNLILGVKLSYSVPTAVSVNVITEEGTAQAGIDYVNETHTLVFQPGQVENIVKIRILNNLAHQPAKRIFKILLTNNSENSQLGFKKACNVEVWDNDPNHNPPDDTTAIARDDIKEAAWLRVYPNPTAGLVSVDIDEEDMRFLGLFDVNGKEVVYSYQTLNSSKENKRILLDLSAVPHGVYFIKANCAKGTFTQKIILTD